MKAFVVLSHNHTRQGEIIVMLGERVWIIDVDLRSAVKSICRHFKPDTPRERYIREDRGIVRMPWNKKYKTEELIYSTAEFKQQCDK